MVEKFIEKKAKKSHFNNRIDFRKKLMDYVVSFKENQCLLRTAEAIRLGIHPRILYQLRDEGLLEHLAKGVYRLVEVPDFSEPDLVSRLQKNSPSCHILDFSLSLS